MRIQGDEKVAPQTNKVDVCEVNSMYRIKARCKHDEGY